MKTITSRRAAGVTLLAALAAIWSITAIPALGDHRDTYPADPEANSASFWENFGATAEGEDDWVCAKTDGGNDAPYTLGDPPAGHEWRLLVVKAGNDHNDLYWNPTSGNSYAATGQGGGGWSHVIECSRPIPATTTTEAPTTTTTEAPTTTTEAPTTTTEAPTTTTEAPTTTTEAPTTTTTTEPEVSSTSTSSTTVPETTETTESEPEVSPTTVQQTSTTGGSEEVDDDEDTDDTLPFTGVDSDDMAMVALVALAAGSGLLLLTRKSDEARGIHRA